MKTIAFVAAALLLGGSAAQAAKSVKVTMNTVTAEGVGKSIGTITVKESKDGVTIEPKLKGLAPGEHGFHIHEHGRCIAPFESAGGHFNPKHAHHGFRNAKGAHAGDLPNVIVPEDGKAKVEIMAYGVTLAKGKPSSLLDQDGAALVIHAGPDDYRTDPAGNSGDRLACGVVEVRTNETAAAATRPDRPTH